MAGDYVHSLAAKKGQPGRFGIGFVVRRTIKAYYPTHKQGISFMMDLWLAPWRASLSLSASMLEMMLKAQKSIASAQGMSNFQPMDEARMREAFHEAADANLRRWGDTADAVNKLPDWYRDLSRVPGGVMTDWFDAARRVKQD
ncbi:MAG: hypothetical protein ACI93G_000504 [Hyphomonas sp.]|jgi:hypothetical protein